MAKAKKNVVSIALVGLAAIVAATQDATKGFAFVGTDEANKLAADGLIDIAPANAVANVPEGHVAARATEAGVAKSAANQASLTPPAAKRSFAIEKNVAVPAISGRGGRTESIYPFDQMEVGDSFFVDKAAKNLASTVSSANQRYATQEKDEAGNLLTRQNRNGETVPKMKLTRTFIVRSVEGGSRIWRKA